jgi:hypothetical protein
MKSKEQLSTLIAEIRRELGQLARLTQEIEQTWGRSTALSPEDQPILLESLALKLHNFYTGCERIFEQIAQEMNGGRPSSYDWHIRLLKSMSGDVPGVRPVVLSQPLVKELVESLKFRQVVRNIYGFELDPVRIPSLIENIAAVSAQFQAEIEQFIHYLQTLADAIEQEE